VKVLERVQSRPASAAPKNGQVMAAGADSSGKPILVVTGLAMEARIAAGPGVDVLCSGCDPARLRVLLDNVAPSRYSGVISFGVSGALDPALRPGDILVATEIRSDAGAWALGSPFSRAVVDRLGRAGGAGNGHAPIHAAFAGVNAPVIEAISKADLRHRTGAAAVDMESHVAAGFGAAVGLPVCAIRVISDPAHRCLPALATRALKANGRVNLAAIAASVAGNPRQIPLLIQAGRDARIAFAALRRVRRLLELGLGLGGTDLG
jgi:adenosylhomocysteine nucleosidase